MDKEYLIPWTAEKSRNVVEYLSKIMDVLHGKASTFSEEELLGIALNDAIKIMAEFNNSNWNPDDRDLIIQQGYKGFEVLLVKYGLLEETTDESQIRLAKSHIQNLRVLLKQKREEGRKKINNLLDSLDINDPWISKVNELTNDVNMGGLEWGEYVSNLSKVLDEWEYSF